jgi:hypothetical protein
MPSLFRELNKERNEPGSDSIRKIHWNDSMPGDPKALGTQGIR